MISVNITNYNLLANFSFFARMLSKPYILSLFFLVLLVKAGTLCAQSLPDTEESFFAKFVYNNQLPPRLLSGRTVLFYDPSFSAKELATIQESFATVGIDAIVALELEKLLGGYDVRTAIYASLQKRELSNFIFFQKNQQGYRCIITVFNGTNSLVTKGQSAWELAKSSLGELLLQLNREALASLKKQNLLVNEHPETELPLRIISGSRIENFTPDFRIDRVAVRLSKYEEENSKLKEVCTQYPFKLEFVADSVTDAVLRQKGFWYVLNCVHAREEKARDWLGYATGKETNVPKSTNNRIIYKFYMKKLEFDNIYLGKQWDAAVTWEESLQNFIANIRKELNVR